MAQQKRVDNWRNHALKATATAAMAVALLDDIDTKRWTHKEIKTRINDFRKSMYGALVKLPTENS